MDQKWKGQGHWPVATLAFTSTPLPLFYALEEMTLHPHSSLRIYPVTDNAMRIFRRFGVVSRLRRHKKRQRATFLVSLTRETDRKQAEAPAPSQPI